MLLDKKKVGYVIKIGAVIISLTFIVSYIPFINSSIRGPENQQSSQVQQTVSALEEAAKKNPKDANTWIRLGNAYYDLNMWDKAAASYEEGLKINPKDVNARVDMAIAYYGMGQIETATAQAKKATEIDPKHSAAFYNLGIFSSSVGKSKEAIEAYKNYIKLAPDGEKVSEAKAQIKVLEKTIKMTKEIEREMAIEAGKSGNNVTVVTEKSNESPATTIKK